MSLQGQLEDLKRRIRLLVPASRVALVDGAVERLKQSGIAERAAKVGDALPAFELQDAHGKLVQSSGFLTSGPLIVTFYRGRWCPYCIAALESWKSVYTRIEMCGAALVAISPQTVRHSAFMQSQHGFPFPVLSDPENTVARQFGIVYRLAPELVEHYRSIFINLENVNGDKSWELPIPATFVLRQNGVVSYASVDPDFTLRAEPEEILRLIAHA